MRETIIAVWFATVVCLAAGDTPANCLFSDIEGTWTFQESSRTGTNDIECQQLDEIVHKKTFTLTYPNLVTDEQGNRGTWNLIYNQGFEVVINERSYFAFSYYEEDSGVVTSFCDRTFVGWSRDRTVRNWSCFQANKNTKDVVSCSNLAQGCLGGFNYLIAGRYSQDQGVVADTCNEYEATDEQCDTDTTCSRTYVSEYSYLGGYYGACNEELMLEALVANGPMAVSYMVYSDFYNYEGGIYHHTGFKNDFNPLEIVSHAVLLVGYGEDEATGEKYWTVKNSWGDQWGVNGYFRIRRGTNECAIESKAVEATPIP